MSATSDLVNWIKSGGNSSDEPKIYIKDKSGLVNLDWKNEKELKSFFSGIEDDHAGDIDKDFIENLGIVLERESNATFDISINSTGDQIAVAIGFGSKAKEVAGVPSVTWSDIYSSLEDTEKAKIIYEYYLKAAHEDLLINKSVKAADIYKKRPNDGNIFVSRDRGKQPYILDRGISFTRFSDEPYTVGFSFSTKINAIFFTNEFFLVNMLNEAFIEEKIKKLAAASSTTPNQLIQKLKNKNLKAAGLIADLTTEPDEDSSDAEQRKEFFKKIEQCILLNIVDKLGEYRQSVRETTLKNNKRLPYGGRVICIDVDENMYSNYAISDGEIWNYSKNFIQSYASNVTYNFIISKIQTVKLSDGSEKEIEMPLLFESATNFLYNNNTGSFSGLKVFGDEAQSFSGLSVKDLSGYPASSHMDNIQFDDISIKFHGENQATAKTNVDVDLSISIPSLMMFQTQFSSTTFYTKDNGDKEPYDYEYSLVDLISYLHRTDLGDVYKSLGNGGARFFNPKYFRNYNRLALKIIPSISTVENDEEFAKIKKHLENNPLILDLALVDHTIDKENEDKNAKIKISYKGYIKSFMQNPKFDIIRTPDEIENQIALERKFIEDLEPQNDRDAIKSIDTNNKMIRDDTSQKVRSVTFLNELILRNKMYIYNVKGSNFSGHVSKKYELLSSNTIWNNYSSSSVNLQSNLLSGSFGDEIAKKVDPETTYSLKYFYLGDLIEIMMDNFYYINSGKWDTMRESMKDFPLKVVLPSFNPMTQDLSSGSRVKSGNKISLADIPISYEWFSNWYIEEFVESEVDFYTIGTFINRLISDVVNGFLMDNCYLHGSHERKAFATRAEFGLFDPDNKNNYIWKQGNFTWLDRLNSLEGGKANPKTEILLTKADAPFFKKDPYTPRGDHCNFIYVYPQIAVFSDFKGVQPNSTSWEKYNVPEMAIGLKSNANQNQDSIFTKSIGFSKEEANYRREARFQTEKLYTLAQLASVYNVTVESSPCLDLFPGMLIWVNPGLYQSPSVRNSIANILGMGGYHLIESVTHTAQIVGNMLSRFKTSTTANWISNGSIRLEGEIPEEQKVKEFTITTTQILDSDGEATKATPTQERVVNNTTIGIDERMGTLNRATGKNQILFQPKSSTDTSATFTPNDGDPIGLTTIEKGKQEWWGYVASDYSTNKKLQGQLIIQK